MHFDFGDVTEIVVVELVDDIVMHNAKYRIKVLLRES